MTRAPEKASHRRSTIRVDHYSKRQLRRLGYWPSALGWPAGHVTIHPDGDVNIIGYGCADELVRCLIAEVEAQAAELGAPSPGARERAYEAGGGTSTAELDRVYGAYLDYERVRAGRASGGAS